MRRDYSIETLQKLQLAGNIKQQVLELAEQREKEVASVEYEVLHTKHNKQGVTVISNHSKIRTKYNTMIGTLIKHGVTTAWKLPEVREKEHATKLATRGTLFLGDREKARQTKLAKGSTGNGYDGKQYVNSKKAKQTKFERYGDENYVNAELANETKIEHGIVSGHESFQRAVDTKRMWYGEHLEVIVAKTADTMLKRHAVPFFVMHEKYRKSVNKVSNINLFWLQILKLHFDNVKVEFAIENRQYDFIINDTVLVEINPTFTHNSTRNWPYERKDKFYHANKYKLAIEHGYKLLCKWDWQSNIQFIMQLIQCVKTNQFPTYDYNEPILHWSTDTNDNICVVDTYECLNKESMQNLGYLAVYDCGKLIN